MPCEQMEGVGVGGGVLVSIDLMENRWIGIVDCILLD